MRYKSTPRKKQIEAARLFNVLVNDFGITITKMSERMEVSRVGLIRSFSSPEKISDYMLERFYMFADDLKVSVRTKGLCTDANEYAPKLKNQ
jgi:hypothetical protein